MTEGDPLARAVREWPEKALRRARAFEAVTRPVTERPTPPTRYDQDEAQEEEE